MLQLLKYLNFGQVEDIHEALVFKNNEFIRYMSAKPKYTVLADQLPPETIE